MKLLIRMAGPVLAILLINGCIQTETEYFLNPDGSGKLVFKITRPIMAGMLQIGDEKSSPDEAARQELDRFLRESKGIEAWQDIAFTVLPGNKLHVTGTAYFNDFSRVAFNGGVFSESRSLRLEPTADGLAIRMTSEDAAAVAREERTPEAIRQEAAQKKAEFEQQQMMLNMMLSGLRDDTILHLPGPVKDARIFQKTGPNTVQLVYEGEKILAALTRLAKDDAWWEKQAAQGAADQPPISELHMELFGTAEPPQILVGKPMKPLFNYPAELAGAREGYAAMRERLGLAQAAQIIPMAEGGDLSNIRIGGVMLIHEEDQKAGIRPFNRSQGLSLAILADFPGAVLKITEAKITSAIADNGEDLLPPRDRDRRISFPKLSKSRTTAILEANFPKAPPGLRGFRELSCDLTYVSSAGTKNLDLGTMELKVGVRSDKLAAEIKSIKPSDWSKGSQTLDLQLHVNPESIAAITFFDERGREIELNEQGSSWQGNRVNKQLSIKGTFPERAKIIVILHDQLKEYQTPLTLRDIDLMGTPPQP